MTRDVGVLGAGHHVVNLAEGHHLQSGVYWMRLVQGANAGNVRVAVID